MKDDKLSKVAIEEAIEELNIYRKQHPSVVLGFVPTGFRPVKTLDGSLLGKVKHYKKDTPALFHGDW